MKMLVTESESNYILKFREAKKEVVLEIGLVLINMGFSGIADLTDLIEAVKVYEDLRTCTV